MSDLLNAASLIMIPSGYSEDKVYSAVPTDGSGDLSFTRSSNGTRINSAGLVEVCPWNLASNSNDFGGLSAITKTTGQVSPIDSTSGSLLTATGSGEHYSGTASLTAIVGNTYTFSVYAKFVQGLNIALRTVFSNGDEDISTIWNLNTGTLVANAGNHTSPTITAVGNGWYRVSITYRPSVVPAFPLLFRLQMAVGTNLSFTATSGDGFLVYGAQVNNGALAPYFPTTDRLNVPRLTYQNGGGGCPSLLLEKQSTNLVTYSEQFDNANWVKLGGASVTANTAISPDGTQNADTLACGTTTALKNGVGTGGAIPFTASIYVKQINFNIFTIGMTDDALEEFQYQYNLDTLAVTGSSTTVWTNTSGTITSVGNGWFRVTMTGTKGTIGAARMLVKGQATSKNYYIWGAQLEQSSYPTSYIPTTSASATRVADVCSKTGIGALIGGTSGTVFFDIKTNPTLSSANYKQFCYYFTSGGAQSYMFLDGANKLQTNSNWGSLFYNTAFQPNTRYKVALVFAPNDFALYVNGVSVATASSGTPNNNADITIGQLAGGENCEFVFNQYTHFPSRLTNSELASLTTI
jgi:hypothetical protein